MQIQTSQGVLTIPDPSASTAPAKRQGQTIAEARIARLARFRAKHPAKVKKKAPQWYQRPNEEERGGLPFDQWMSAYIWQRHLCGVCRRAAHPRRRLVVGMVGTKRCLVCKPCGSELRADAMRAMMGEGIAKVV